MKTRTIIVLLVIISGILMLVYGKDYLSKSSEPEELFESSAITNPHAGEQAMAENQEEKPFYQGEIVNFEHGGGYTYIEVKEKTEKTFWIAVEKADVKKGDIIQFQKELVMHNFKSKALNKTFDEVMFASNLYHKVPE
ncbi:MAG: hypothetical protein B6I18_04055 [Bacteroidetes bacterium 4572_112]|nr:MAG: hypothetical protein B6I18_04055 [Bacteroidetes bacterium 4572_112]